MKRPVIAVLFALTLASSGCAEEPARSAKELAYDGAASALAAKQVQAAIDELAGRVQTLEGQEPAPPTATEITLDGAAAGLSAKTVQGGAEELATGLSTLSARVDALDAADPSATLADHGARLSAVEAATTSRSKTLTELQAALTAQEQAGAALETKVTDSQKEVDTLKTSATQNGADLDTVETELTTLKAELATASANIEALQALLPENVVCPQGMKGHPSGNYCIDEESATAGLQSAFIHCFNRGMRVCASHEWLPFCNSGGEQKLYWTSDFTSPTTALQYDCNALPAEVSILEPAPYRCCVDRAALVFGNEFNP